MNKKSHESIIARHDELKPTGGSKITPRVGFYYILSVFENAQYLTHYKARVLWKEQQQDNFNKNAEFVIQLTSLKETSPDPTNFDAESLIGKVIHVISTSLNEIIFKSKPTPIVVCNWTIDDTPAIVENFKPSFLESLPDTNLNEIVEQFDVETPPDDFGANEGYGYGDDDYGDDGFGDDDGDDDGDDIDE